MEIIKVSACYQVVNGEVEFLYTSVLFKHGDDIYRGCCPSRIKDTPYHTGDIVQSVEHLNDIVMIRKEDYCPPAPPQCTTVPVEIPGCYVKRPNLMAHGGGMKLSELVLKDIEACEILKQHPHPNIARYHGCQIDKDRRVTSLLFEKYQETLMERLNPGHLNKQEFTSKRPYLSNEVTSRYLTDIESGIRHLHSVGLIHNDINPSNIMFDSDDRLVIIDFDSCRRSGTSLDSVKQTPEWYDKSVEISTTYNDLNSLEEIRAWITGTSTDFKF